MNQQQYALRKLKVQGALTFVLCAVASGLVFATESLEDSMKKKLQTLDQQVATLTQTLSTSTQQQQTLKELLPLYEFLKLKDGEQTLSRAQAASQFDALRKQFALENLRVDLGPVIEIVEEPLKKHRAQGLSVEITLQADTYTDIDAIGVLESLQKELGMFSFTELKMAPYKDKETDKQRTSLSLKASWYGVRQLAASPTATTPGQPVMPTTPLAGQVKP